jgi:hypothetical protein
MRLDNILSEDQINELNLIKNVQGAWKGATDGGGLKGAVSGYKASQSAIKGADHSSRIVANLKRDYMALVGGGEPSTYDNLIKFLGTHGLKELDTLANPTAQSNTGAQPEVPPAGTSTATPATAPSNGRIEPTLDPEVPSTAPPANNDQADLKARLKAGNTLSSRTGTGFKNSRVGVPVQKLVGKNPDGSPKFSVVREDAEDVLNNRQIDDIIKAAVKKNYSRIVAAQRGLPVDDEQPATGQPEAPSEPAAEPGPTATNPFSDPDKLAEDWKAYIAGGGQLNPQLRKLARNIMANTPTEPKPEATPAQPKPTRAELDADHERMASGSNEGYSRFLGIQL